MRKSRNEILQGEPETYVFIDVSNIRSACLKTLGFRIDFIRLITYWRRKYINLKDVRYYEGIAVGDAKKQRMFRFLQHKGYTICALERKSYNWVDTESKLVQCPKCGNRWTAKFTQEHRTMKSNVDVYLATELLSCAVDAKQLTQIVLVSCDGDYAEMIETALARNANVSISVLATPMVKNLSRNTLSSRLCKISTSLSRYKLLNINDIRDYISGEQK